VATLTGAARAAEIERIAGGDAARKEALAKVARTSEAMATARAAWEKAKADPNATLQAVNEAEKVYLDALDVYTRAVENALAGNLDTEKFGDTLRLYVSAREAGAIGMAERDERQKAFDQRLEQLRGRYPARRAKIDRVVSAYTDWAEKRIGLDDPADLKRLVAKVGVLEFRIAATLPNSAREPKLTEPLYLYYQNQLTEQGPMFGRSRNEPYQWFELRAKSEKLSTDTVIGKYANKRYMLLCNESELVMLHETGRRSWTLKSSPGSDRLNRPAVAFRMDSKGAEHMGTLTAANIGKLMAILLDNQAYSAPNIKEAIYGNGIIEGDFTQQQVAEMVQVLNAGALEGQVNENPISEKTIAPSIGADNRQAGIRAAIWGLIGVAVFMIAYYLAAGAIANVALLLNLVLVLGAMSFIEAVFTLPGIAGVILTIGMAVDANVLIFERLREEQAKTQSMRMAIRNAYSNAASAILDGNVTTLLTCVILGWVGTEEVRGFAITLGLGVMFSLFTALIVTRWIFQLLLGTGLIKGRVRMLSIIGTPKVNWMAKRRVFWMVSITLVAVGIAALSWQRNDILGLEFSSGTQATFTFKRGEKIPGPDGQKALPQRSGIEQAIRDKADELAAEARAKATGPQAAEHAAAAEALRKLALTAKVETVLDVDKAQDWLTGFDANSDRAIDGNEWRAGKLPPELFSSADADGNGRLDRTELADRLPERQYQVSTTVADLKLLRKVVSEAFGTALDMPGEVTFALQTAGAVPGLNTTLDEKNKGLTHISTSLAEGVSPELQGKFLNFVGGAVFVIHDISPPLAEAELASRISTMRLQPDFAGSQFNQTQVIGLKAGSDSEGFSSLAVLTRNPNVDYIGRPEQWKVFARGELKLLTAALERSPSIQSTQFNPAIAAETGNLAIIAFVLSWMAIIVYLWIRFGSARWGLAAVICLIHDTVIAVGLVAVTAYVGQTSLGRSLMIFPFKIDMAMVAAFLTIIGYSVNDTIVVFDRIRENRGKLASVDEQTINRSINQTLSRTLLTTATTLIAVVVMYIFGGAGIHAFTYALLVGIVFGTYSSVAIASPMLLGFKRALVGRAVRRPAAVPGK